MWCLVLVTVRGVGFGVWLGCLVVVYMLRLLCFFGCLNVGLFRVGWVL